MGLRATLARRGGSSGVIELPHTSLTCTRVLNEAGTASLRLDVATVTDEAGPALADATAWRDEIAVWDEADDDAPLWAGPLRPPTWTRAGVGLPASDLFAWFDHRCLPRNRQYRDTDLGLIFANHALDALSADPSPNITVVPGSIGVTGDRDVLASQHLLAGDAMRELMRSGVDFTMAGRELLLASVDPARLPPLIDAYVDDPSLGPAADVATEVTVLGSTTSTGQVVGVARAPDAAGGLLQTTRNEPAIRDSVSARHAAQVELAAGLGAGTPFTAKVLPGWAPWAALVPGRVVQVGITCGLRDVLGDHRLVSVTFSADADGDPKVTASFVPVLEV